MKNTGSRNTTRERLERFLSRSREHAARHRGADAESRRTRRAGRWQSAIHADSMNSMSATASTVVLKGWPAACRVPPAGRAARTCAGPRNIMTRRQADAADDRDARPRRGPAPKLASTTASTHQAIASPIAAADSDSVPISDSLRPRSWMMRASTGNAVMAMAAPRNSVALNCETFAENSPGTLRRYGVPAMATRNGTTMPEIDTATALGAFARKSSLRNSSPTRNMYRPMPSCATTYSTRLRFGRKQEPLNFRAPAALTTKARAPRRRSFRRSPAADAATGAPASRRAGRSPG